MPSRKRVYDEVDSEESIPEVSAELSTLKRIRGMWEFAAFMQYLFFFGKAVKIDDVDVEDFEDECLKPGPSERLNLIALALLKNVSSHKGLTPDLLDEYTRRQYVAKAPKRNPFGEDDEPRKFAEFDVFTKIRVLQQLATWTLNNPNPIREKLDERESEQVNWRIEPFGWDKDDRVYFVLDDNRLYRRTDAPPPANIVPKTPVKSKSRSKKSSGRHTRSNKRPRIGRRVIETSPEETEEEHEEANGVEKEEPPVDEFHMQRWELIAVSMDEYNEFLDTIRKSRDPNERALVKSIQDHVMPILVEAEEERKRKEARRMKELEMLQKLATSKRSSRLADKQDKIRLDREAAEEEKKRRAELEMAHKEQRRQQQMEEARESRRETREQRLKEREVKRILEQERLEHEQQLLLKMETEGVIIDAERGRISERQLKADMEKRKQELQNLQQDDSWYFDCVCGTHGPNLDDGTHSIACEKCGTWQHSKCNSISEQQAEREDFHFVCRDCKKKEQNPKKEDNSVKLKLNMASSPSSTTPKPKSKPKVGADGKTPTPKRTPAQPKANGTANPLVYPGPPPPAPGQNGARPQSNGNGPTTFQWHAYQPRQPVSSGASYPQSYPHIQSQHGQQSPQPGPAPTAPMGFMHHTQSPQRAPYAQPPSVSPRPTGTQYQPPLAQSPQPSSARQLSPPVQRPQQSSSTVLPPIQANAQPGSPHKRPLSSGYGSIVPPPLMKSPVTNGTHPISVDRPKSSQSPPAPYSAQTTTPAAQRAPSFTAPQPTFSPNQGQTPFNAAPGYSPTKQPSPRIASSPYVPSVASPPVVSPPKTAAAHFSPPKPTTSISPIKHDSSPVQAPVALLGQTPSINASESIGAGVTQPSAPLSNPIQTAPQILPPPPAAPQAPPVRPENRS